MKWAAVISAEDAYQLGRLRRQPGVEVCAGPEAVWMRGPELDDALELALRKVSGARRFTVSEDGGLVPVGAAVPTDRLPESQWLPLGEYVVPQAPTAALPAELPPAVPLRLVRSAQERPANALLTDLQTWLAYICNAPLIRLRPLTFAAAGDGRVIVRGRPLPPVRGTPLVETAGIAAACGYGWLPAVDAEVVRAGLGLEADDLAILAPDGGVEIVRRDDFVGASRSAVRLTARELGHG